MSNLVKVSQSRLPTAFGEYAIHIYQDLKTLVEHVALVMGDVASKDDVLVRVHSECLTGDIFSSTRCDCGEQLELAQQRIMQQGSGVIIYIRDHEGRGIGLANKIRAYELQDSGLDTVEANLALGLAVDKRSFEVAAEIIKSLGIGSIRLMSNNPDKLSSLSGMGVVINKLESHQVSPNPDNSKYLATKQLKLGHLLDH